MKSCSRISESSPYRRPIGRLPLKVFYTGTSMSPTLRAGDVLHVSALRAEQIRCGDVAVFIVDARSQVVVHRIVSRTDAGFVSMGDNNASPDSHLLPPGDIIGRVFVAENHGKTRRIRGGLQGRVEGFVRRLGCLTERKMCGVLRPLYRFLAESGVFRKLGRPALQTKVVMYHRHTGDAELQLLWKNRAIGRLASGNERWVIKRPFRLLIDEKRLPILNEWKRAFS
jgi:hypothetical protein